MYIGFISNKYNVNNEVADEANQTPGTDSEGQNPGSDHKIRYPDPTIRPFVKSWLIIPYQIEMFCCEE